MKTLSLIIGIALAIFAIVCIVYFFIPQKNPIWIKRCWKNIEVGEVRWLKDSPKTGNGHAVALIVEKQNGYIYYNRYEWRRDSWEHITTRSRHEYRDFLAITGPEPVYGKTIFNK